MLEPIGDPVRLTDLLGREVTAVLRREEQGFTRVVALELAGGARFELPAGNALRSGGELAEVRALLAGLPRRLAERIRSRLGPGEPDTARIAAAVNAALADPDALLDGRDGHDPG